MVVIARFNAEMFHTCHILQFFSFLSTLSHNKMLCGHGNPCQGPVLQFLLVQLLRLGGSREIVFALQDLAIPAPLLHG